MSMDTATIIELLFKFGPSIWELGKEIFMAMGGMALLARLLPVEIREKFPVFTEIVDQVGMNGGNTANQPIEEIKKKKFKPRKR